MRAGAQRPAYMDKPWFKAMHGGGTGPRMELTEQQKAFIEYLVDPDSTKPTQAKWCEANGVGTRTATGWKKNKLFRSEWEKRAFEVYGGPERVNAVVDAVHLAAVGGDMKAAQLFLQYVDKFTPKREVVTGNRELQDMSDDELAALGDNITALRSRKTS